MAMEASITTPKARVVACGTYTPPTPSTLPKYVHLGLILDDDGKKMSKRRRADVLRDELNRRYGPA